MKVALVSHEFPPFRGGGIGTYVRVMSDAFARVGHEVHVVTNRFVYGSTDPLHAKPVQQEGNLWVHRIDAITDDWQPRPPHDHPRDLLWQLCHRWSPYLYYAEHVAMALERICREHRIDVVEFPECAAEGYAVIRRKRLGLGFTALPISVTLHSPVHEIYVYNLYSRWDIGFQRRAMMEDYCIRWADAVNSPSRLLAEIVYERLGLRRDSPPCDVIPLPMDFGSIPDLAPAAAGGEPSLLFVGRLEPRKGVKYLVDAAVKVMHDHPTLTVSLIGQDCYAGEAPEPMTQFLRRRIPERLRPRFHFLGLLPREQLFARYASATACVFAAPWDNFPLSCVEAMACGGCVVASDYTGMAEMIEHEQSGLLFRARAVDSLAAAIRRAIEEPELTAGIRAAAPRRIRALCDPDAAVRNRLAHYERTIAQHEASARRRVVAVPRAGERVALLVANWGDAEAVRGTVASAMAAAAHAGLALDVSVVGMGGVAAVRGLPAGVHTDIATEESEAAVRRVWLERVAAEPPDYLITLHPGETLEPVFLSATRSALLREPRAAWATSWCLPAEGQGDGVYAGFDFSTPLELLRYHPVPFALVRYEAWRQVGGWNLDLPPGWREWDLFLAFEQADLRGIVLPLWLARYVPRAESTLRPPSGETLSVILGAIVARSPRLFARHGRELWLFRTLNSVDVPAPEPASGPEWGEWWARTKVSLSRQWPGAARAYRALVKRKTG